MSAPETCHFQPGQLVECYRAFDPHAASVDPFGAPANPLGAPPEQGCVYTVTEVSEGPFGGHYLTLAELNPGMSYLALHFRPVQTPSIDCFRQLLAPLPERELA